MTWLPQNGYKDTKSVFCYNKVAKKPDWLNKNSIPELNNAFTKPISALF